MPFEVAIETSEPGSRIEVADEYVGVSPVTVTSWGDSDGTFHGEGDERSAETRAHRRALLLHEPGDERPGAGRL